MKFDLFGQAGRIQEEIKKAKEELEKRTVESSVGGGMVKVVANGKQRILSIQIDPELLKKNDPDMMRDLIMAGVNEALEQSQKLILDEMTKIAGPFSSFLKGM